MKSISKLEKELGFAVAPLVGAWIEIMKYVTNQCSFRNYASLPSWERGLKSISKLEKELGFAVAPLVGAWIEINAPLIKSVIFIVAPLVGAWIEIM